MWTKQPNKKPQTIASQGFVISNRGTVGSRTPNLLIRSEVLYPVELRNHFLFMDSFPEPDL